MEFIIFKCRLGKVMKISNAPGRKPLMKHAVFASEVKKGQK